MITEKQFNELLNVLRSFVEGPGSRPTGLEGIGIALAGDQLKIPIGFALESLAGAIRAHGEAVTDAACTIAEAINANVDNGECMRAFRDACRAFTDSKAS
jgi:hypothetical protein